MMKPLARRHNLVVRELPDELLVYDLDRHQAHCLNRTAAVVFRHADGQREVAELAALLGGAAASGPGQAMVGMALDQLREAHLLDPETASAVGSGLSRRDLMRRVGLGAAFLLPLVTSVLAPSPAEAAATCVTDCQGQLNGTPCTSFGASPCTASCVCAGTCSTGDCSDGGGA